MRQAIIVTASLAAVMSAAVMSVVGPGEARASETPAAVSNPVGELLASLPISRDYRRVRASDVGIDRERLRLLRYERIDDRNTDLGGEHVSVLLDRWGRLRGFVRMDLSLREGELPRAEEAEAIARDFLARHAPDLSPSELVVAGVAPHATILKADDGAVELTGMKVKMRRGVDGPWLWVTIGADRNVMTFERDVVWTAKDGVKSQRWLSDEWIGRALERLEGRGA